MNKTTLYELAAIVTLISAGYAGYQWWVKTYSGTRAQLLANQDDLKTTTAAAMFPSSSPTDPLFSNFGRRIDLSAPLDLGDQPMLYGQAIPT